MRPRPLLPLLAATVLTAVAPAAAVAGTAAQPAVQVDRDCYLDTGSVARAQVAATGFTPSTPVSITLDGQPYAANGAATDATGSIDGSFEVPLLRRGVQEALHTLTFTDDQRRSASATFRSSRVSASFSPRSGSPKTLKVRFSAYGMALVAPRPSVYVHYVAPGGRVKATYRLGTAQGACGHLTSARRRLFPFRPVLGLWTLQVDTARAYRKAGPTLPYPATTMSVLVRRIIIRK